MMPVRVALGALALVGGVLLPLGRPAPAAAPTPVSACTVGEQVYGGLVAGRGPAGLAAGYEVELNGTVYGPNTGLTVPWPAVYAWAAAHPETGVGFCDPNAGYTLTGLQLREGWAYVLVGPRGGIYKVYLATRPLAWD
ncbi:MAG TPA: hypothetical protein VNM16_01560 [Bacillota bacterium]|nr:hypothetical protein [Bacillota bacterium]